MAHPLSGADPATLIRLWRLGGAPENWVRALSIALSVAARSPFSAAEHLVTADRARRASAEMPAPVFILGHWRSGTTHLYNLMAAGGGFGYVPPIAVGLPWDMGGLARILRPVLERALPRTRWIDRMEVTPTSPQEDEIALASMSDISFYHALYLPRRFDALLDRGLFLGGVTEAEITRWEDRLRLFHGRLWLRFQKPLLIKNPVYTARIPQMLRLYPEARFIFLHRRPTDVVRSMRNFHARLLEVMALQHVPNDLDIDTSILRVFDRMMARYVEDAAALGPDRLIEIGYDMLAADPLGTVREIHEALDLPGYAMALPGIEAHLAAVRRFQPNRFDPDPAFDARAERALGRWSARWGY